MSLGKEGGITSGRRSLGTSTPEHANILTRYPARAARVPTLPSGDLLPRPHHQPALQLELPSLQVFILPFTPYTDNFNIFRNVNLLEENAQTNKMYDPSPWGKIYM